MTEFRHSFKNVCSVIVMSTEDSSVQAVRTRVIFHGHVQGVGFRYTVRGIAKKFPVVGYVRNLADGTVELETEGAIEAVRFFLDDIRELFEQNIESCEEGDIPVICKEDDFTIHH